MEFVADFVQAQVDFMKDNRNNCLLAIDLCDADYTDEQAMLRIFRTLCEDDFDSLKAGDLKEALYAMPDSWIDDLWHEYKVFERIQ